MLHVALCLVFITCIFTNGKSVLGHLDKNDNVKCQALPSVVPVNQHGVPHFVTLYRCQGGDSSPLERRCVNRTMTPVKVTVLSPSGNIDIQMENHTSCEEECIYSEQICQKDLFDRDEKYCSCKCKHSTAPKGKECGPDMTWSKQGCKCECNLKQEDAPRRKVLDKEKCVFACPVCSQVGYHPVEPSCRCKPNQQTVGGREGSDNSNQGKMLAAVVIGEFLFLYLIFDFLLYSKETGLMYFIKGKCSSKSQQQPPQGPHVENERRCLAPHDESNGEQVTVCVHSNGNAKPTSHALHMSSL